jgi:hypothetical protein
VIAVSHAQNPNVLRRARDLYAVYNASCDGKNYQGLPCPPWDKLTEAVRGHWYVVALRSLELEPHDAIARGGMCDASDVAPGEYVLGHLADPPHAVEVWAEYAGAAK